MVPGLPPTTDFLGRELDTFLGGDAEPTPRAFVEHLRRSLRDRRPSGVGLDDDGLVLYFRDQAGPERIRIGPAPAPTLADHIEATLVRAPETAARLAALPTVQAGVELQKIYEADSAFSALVHVELRRLNVLLPPVAPPPVVGPIPPVPAPVADPPAVDAIRPARPTTPGRRPAFAGGNSPARPTKVSIPTT